MLIMSNARISPILSFTPSRSSTSGYFGNDHSSGGNKENHSGKSFQDIFKQQLEVEPHMRGCTARLCHIIGAKKSVLENRAFAIIEEV
jgi:hypothetical protein